MPDDLSIKRPEDPRMINISQSWEVDYWCNQFGCTEDDLRRAVSIVGSHVKDVKDWINKNRR